MNETKTIIITGKEIKEFENDGWKRLFILSIFYQGGFWYDSKGKERTTRGRRIYKMMWRQKYPEVFRRKVSH